MGITDILIISTGLVILKVSACLLAVTRIVLVAVLSMISWELYAMHLPRVMHVIMGKCDWLMVTRLMKERWNIATRVIGLLYALYQA
jgi:hypothetical protein